MRLIVLVSDHRGRATTVCFGLTEYSYIVALNLSLLGSIFIPYMFFN